MLTTVVIAITVEGVPDGKFHSSAVASFLRGWEAAGLPEKAAQDIRMAQTDTKTLATLLNKQRLGETATIEELEE